MEKTYKDSTKDHQASVLHCLHGMQQKEQLCDFQLSCNDGRRVRVHKCVVVAASTFLRLMMEINASNDFNVPCESLSTLSKVVHFMYTGELTVGPESVYGVLNCCLYLGLNQAEQFCRTFLRDNSMPLTDELKNVAITLEPISIKEELLDDSFAESYFEEDLNRDWKPSGRKPKRKKRNFKKKISGRLQEKVKAAATVSPSEKLPKRKVPRKHLLRVRTLRFVYRAHETCQRTLSCGGGADGRLHCGRCRVKFNTRSQLLCHYKLNHTKTYKCKYCVYTESSIRSMLLHLKWRHHSIKSKRNFTVLEPCTFSYKCHHCDRIFLHKNNLNMHLKEVKAYHGRKGRRRLCTGSWTCVEEDCQSAERHFSYCSALKQHMRTSHPNIMYSCSHVKCTFKTSVKHLYTKHQRLHQNRENECEICGRCFSNSLSAKNHRFLMHNVQFPGMKIFPCTEDGCGYKAVSVTGLQSHVRRHNDSTAFSCQACDKVLRTQKGLEQHILRVHVGIKSCMCEQCGQAFFCESELKSHAEMHKDVKPFQCFICDYGTHVKATFQSHLFNVHRVKHEERMHVLHCDQCTYATTARNRFLDHMRNHSGTRDIACQQCDKLFITQKNLRNHIKRIHAPKIQCELCAYKAGERTQLRTHVRLVHTDLKVKPYKCGHCPFTCTLPGNCRKHIAQCHPHYELRVIKLTKEQLAEKAGPPPSSDELKQVL